MGWVDRISFTRIGSWFSSGGTARFDAGIFAGANLKERLATHVAACACATHQRSTDCIVDVAVADIHATAVFGDVANHRGMLFALSGMGGVERDENGRFHATTT